MIPATSSSYPYSNHYKAEYTFLQFLEKCLKKNTNEQYEDKRSEPLVYRSTVEGENDIGDGRINLSSNMYESICDKLHETYPNNEYCAVYKKLPVHFAIVCNASLSVMRKLVEVFADTLCTIDDHGKLPIHLAIESEMSVEVLELVLTEKVTDLTLYREKLIESPLIYAITIQASETIIHSIISLFPSSVSLADVDDRLPIHHIILAADNDEQKAKLSMMVNRAQQVAANNDEMDDVKPGAAQRRRHIHVVRN